MFGRFLREKVLEIGAALLAAVFLVTGRITPEAALRSLDVDLLLVLFALLVTVEILRASGELDYLAASVVRRVHSTTTFSIVIVAFTGGLAAFITNDVALFVVIPFTVIASRIVDFDLERVVILEVVASNLIGCLTPLGNPQNLFVYHRSGWNAGRFITTMLPFVVWCAVGIVAVILMTGRRPAAIRSEARAPERQKLVAIGGAFCFACVVLVIGRGADAWVAAVAALVIGTLLLRRRMFAIDFSILPLFFFAFIVVEGLRSFAWQPPGGVYLTSIAVSQVISNVPATVLLTPFAGGEWRELLYGVNAGGCGTIIASLANLLGWRIYVRESNRDPRFFRRLTLINVAFLGWAALGGALLLRWLP